MKHYIKIWSLAFLTTIVVVGIIGCANQSAQRTAYNTIFTIEQTADATVDGYYTAVIKGTASTNGLANVSQKFNQLQAACTLAAATSQNGTNALASTQLIQELADLISFIGTLSNK